jgi:hypothetical protein
MTGILAFALKHWKLILGGLAVTILSILWRSAAGDAANMRQQRDSLAQWQQAVRQDVSRAAGVRDAKGNPGLLPIDRIEAQIVYLGKSIDALQGALDDKNAESLSRARAYTDARAADAATLATMDARAKADASRLDTLRRLARDLPDNPACRVPAALAANLEGL